MSEERRSEAAATAKLFVGRERELAGIEAALDDAAAGRGQLLMLAGEPGIGKTSLADRATAAAAARGFHAGWARCWEAGGAPAYWPWLDLLGELARLLDDAALAQALGDGAVMLAALVPELRARVALAAEAIPPAEEGRFRLWRAAAALLREAAATRPMFIVLDDLHAADHSSLGLLHFVAHQLRRMRVVVLGTYRDVEARLDADTDELLARIRHEGTTLALGPLDRAAAVTLVRHRNPTLDQDAEARILDRTQGNPLFLEEMLRLRDEQGAEAIVAGEVPRGVRDAIRQRLNRVAGEARPLLDLAAVAGDEIDPALLAAASGRELGWVQARLAEVAEVGLVATRAGRRRFGHALFREVLERELGDEARRALHGSVLRALERRTDAASALPAATYAELAHHALDGPPELLPRAVDLAIRAAQRAGEVLAYDDAIRLLEQARDAVQAAGSVPLLQARVLIALGEARIRRGEADAGQASCRAAFTLASAAQAPELGAAAALRYGQVFAFGVVDPVLVAMLEESLRALPPGDSPLRARLLARLAAAVQPSPDAEEPVRLAREAIAIARRVGDEATLLETLHDGISAVMDIAPPEEQRALNLEAEQLATRRGDRERLLRTHGRLALAHLALGELGPADTRVGAFERLAAELKAPWTAWRGFMLRAVRATMHGRFAEAAALGDEALRVGRAAGDANVAKIWASNRAALLRAAERHDEMLAFEPAVQEMFARFGHAAAWQGASAALVHARVEDAERTRFHIDQLPEFLRPPYRNLFALFFIAEAAALAGPPELAEGIYERIRGLPDSYVVLGMSYMSWEGPSVRLLALLAAFLQRWDDATAHFEDALGCCRHLGTLP
ncbi:MAG: AAA family ATPase [Pseudomonadota bacterium]